MARDRARGHRTSLPYRPVAIATGAVVIVTVVAALVSVVDPALGPGGHPQPTLHGTLWEALSIFAGNARLLIVPLLLVAGRWPTERITRLVGDTVVAALLVASPVTIGLALGRYGFALVPYLPHLPLEDAALATAVGAWLSRRLPNPAGAARGSIVRYGAWMVALTALAALTETYLVPHAT